MNQSMVTKDKDDTKRSHDQMLQESAEPTVNYFGQIMNVDVIEVSIL